MAQQRTATLGPDRFLLGIVTGAVLLIAVSLIVVLAPRPSPPPPDPTSPTGVVDAYIRAVRAGDVDGARGYLTREARATAIARGWPSPGAATDRNLRIVVDSVSNDGTTATVQLSISRSSAGDWPFPPSTSHSVLTISLVREDGVWRVSSPVEAYALR